MALARIVEVNPGNSASTIRVDTGSNRFFQWLLGSDRSSTPMGEVIDHVSHRSGMLERVGTGAFQTWFDIEVDPSLVTRDNQFFQLLSFKDAEGTSPAWSSVRSIYLPMATTPDFGTPMNMSRAQGAADQRSRAIAFSADEQPISSAMFWSELSGLLGQLAPLGEDLVSLAGDENVQAGVGGVLEMIGPLLKGLIGAAQAPTPLAQPTFTAPASAVSPAPCVCAPAVVARDPSMAGPRPVGHSGALAVDGGVLTGPMIAGLVGAVAGPVLKALTPLLQKAPEMFETYMDHPVRLIHAISGARRQAEEVTNNRIKQSLSAGERQLLISLLGANGGGGAGVAPFLSGAASVRTRALSSSPIVDARIDAALIPPDDVPGLGRRNLYGRGGDLVFELRLGTALESPDRPIAHVVAHLEFSDADSGEPVLERRIELSDVWLNRSHDLRIDAATAALLPSTKDLNLSVDVLWTGRDAAVYTTPTRAVQQLSVVDDFVVSGFGDRSGESFALTDPTGHRAFWQRIWEGGAPDLNRWELSASTRYYYRIGQSGVGNGRMETKFKLVDDQSRQSDSKVVWGGFLKSGMELDPSELAALTLSRTGISWTPAELDAVAACASPYERQASTSIELRGRTEERGSLWVFPVMAPIEVSLHRVVSVSDRGAVDVLEPIPKPLLLPVDAVFVGMENEG